MNKAFVLVNQATGHAYQAFTEKPKKFAKGFRVVTVYAPDAATLQTALYQLRLGYVKIMGRSKSFVAKPYVNLRGTDTKKARAGNVLAVFKDTRGNLAND